MKKRAKAQLAPGDVEGSKEGFLPKSAAAGKEEAESGEEEWMEADVVIAGDGVRSIARRDMLKIHGEEDHSKSTVTALRIYSAYHFAYRDRAALQFKIPDKQLIGFYLREIKSSMTLSFWS